MNNIKIYEQSAIKINNIYFDPFHVDEENHDAEVVFITHSHYDHFSIEDINKVSTQNTIFVGPKDVIKKLNQEGFTNTIMVEPGEEYKIKEYNVKTTYAYNKHKPFHPKHNKWVGYIININDESFYIPGDTDVLDENKNIISDTVFIPIGGTYTMDVYEASQYINELKPKRVIPIHYGTIVGEKNLDEEFARLTDKNIAIENYLKFE